MNHEITARSLALESLLAVERDGRYPNLEIDARLKKAEKNGTPLSDADRALYTRLVYGVTERRITLDYLIAQFSQTPPDDLDGDVKNALRLGFYQLVFMDRIPEHAAVGESAGLVKRARVGYVNAVLRSFLRAGKPVTFPDKAELFRYLSVKFSVPEPLCRHFVSSYGEAEAEPLLEAMNREPKVCLRVNPMKTDVAEAAALLGGEIAATDGIVRVDGLGGEAMAGLRDGRWFVQDEASRAATLLLGAKPGETVVDTCACPGGKTFSLALDMRNTGKVYAFDLHANKLSLVKRGAERLGLTIVETEERDARRPKEELCRCADRVLCDAPCSGLGVIAKKPDIRYKDLAATEGLPDIQYAVLSGASRYVRRGGVLVYSTCTLNPKENEEVVTRFARENPSFTVETMRTFFPHKDGCDGFFAAKLICND